MAEGNVKQIRYDDNRLREIAKEKNLTLADIGVKMGHDRSFLTHKTSRREATGGTFMTLPDLKLLSLILGIREEELYYHEPEPEQDNTQSFRNLASLIQQEMAELKSLCTEAAKMSESNHRDLQMVKKSLEKLDGDNEAAWNKLNSITTATAKLRDQVDGLKLDINDQIQELSDTLAVLSPDESEQLRKAKLLVTEALKSGTAEQNDVYNKASAQGINKKYIDRAKSEMNVIVTAQGYGKNQSKVWSYR